MDNEDAPIPHFLLRPQRVLSFPRHSPRSQHLQRCPIHSGLSQTTAPQPSGLLQATLRLNPNPKGFGGYRRTVTPSLPTQDQAPWRSPDSDGDAGAAVALLLMLPTATPHQDVAVLQLLCCCYRQPRAALPARGGQERWHPGQDVPCTPQAVLTRIPPRGEPFQTSPLSTQEFVPQRHLSLKGACAASQPTPCSWCRVQMHQTQTKATHLPHCTMQPQQRHVTWAQPEITPLTHVRQKEMSFFSLFSSISPSTACVCVRALTCRDITCLANV